MLKKTLFILWTLLSLGLLSSCGDEGDETVNEEKTAQTPLLGRDALYDAISSGIVDYVVDGTTAAFDEMTSYWNYPYIAYTYVYSWFSDRDLLAEQLNEKLNVQVKKTEIDEIIRTQVERYNATNADKISLKTELAKEQDEVWEKEVQQTIQQNETVENVKEVFLIDLQDNGVNLLVVLAVLIPLSMIMKNITKAIAGCYDEIDENHLLFSALSANSGFWGTLGWMGAEILVNGSVMRDIARLDSRKQMINICYIVIDIAVLVGSIYYFGGKSEANFEQYAEQMVQSIVNLISNYDLTYLFI